MIANIKSLEMYCKDYKNIENYDTAIKSPLRYDLHHRREISEHKSLKDLKEDHLYYDRPPEELIFLEHGEHTQLHKKGVNHKGEKNPMFGRHWHQSEETRKKLSEANKGKPKSAETRRKMSEANRGEKNPMFGRHWRLENGKHVYTE